PAIATEALKGVKALVVDRSVRNREVVRTMMTSWGCRVDEAGDGDSALDLLHEAASDGDPFAVVLVDRDLPETAGRPLLRQIEESPALRTQHCLVMSPFGDPAEAHGPERVPCVSKPVIEARLREALTETLGRRSATKIAPTHNRTVSPAPAAP